MIEKLAHKYALDSLKKKYHRNGGKIGPKAEIHFCVVLA